jgi:ethanolamine utilization microcompartment shell protein EutL
LSKVFGIYVIDKVQPQTAGYMSIANRNGLVTRPGMALAWIAVSPTADVEKVIDMGLKRSDVKLSFLQMDSRVGFVVFQSHSVAEIRDMVEAIAAEMQWDIPEGGAKATPTQFVSSVDHQQAYLKNKSKMGSLCIPGDALCTMECDPPGFALAAMNEAEKSADIKIVDFKFTGSMGRLIISGADSNVRAARDAALGLAEEAA